MMSNPYNFDRRKTRNERRMKERQSSYYQSRGGEEENYEESGISYSNHHADGRMVKHEVLSNYGDDDIGDGIGDDEPAEDLSKPNHISSDVS